MGAFKQTSKPQRILNPADKLKELAGLVDDVFQLMPSGKYMVGRNLSRMEPTASLQCRVAE